MSIKYVSQTGLAYFWSALKTLFGGKVDKVAGKGLSTNDYTAADQSKLGGIEAGANAYTHPATHSADIITDGTTNKAYTATEQTKLSGIAAGAEVNVQSDWNAASGDAFIANKPTLGALAAKATVAAADIDSNAVETAKIKNANVTSAKLANMAAYTLKGRNSGTTGVPGDVTMLDVAEYSLAQGTTATSVADAEYIPVSVSSTSLKKITWANVIAAIKTALFSTTNGIAKLNGSGGVSAATAGTDYQAPLTAGTDYETPWTSATALPTTNTAMTNKCRYRVASAVGTYQFQCPATDHDIWVRFTTSSTPNITWGSNVVKFVNETPTFAASTEYEMTIVDGRVAVVKLVSV